MINKTLLRYSEKLISHTGLSSKIVIKSSRKAALAEVVVICASIIKHAPGKYYGTKYSRMDQVKFVEVSFYKIWSDMKS